MAKSKQAQAVIAGTYMRVSPELIDENPRNPNKQSKQMFADLVASIRKDGFKDPINVREMGGGRYEVISGAHRLRAALKLGMAEVPILNLGKVDDVDAFAQLIKANNIHGVDDQDELSALLRTIREDGGDEAIQNLGFTDAQLADLLDDLGDDHHDDDDNAPPPDDKPVKIKAADVAACFELEGAKQEQLKALIKTIRKWRSKTPDPRPAWQLLSDMLVERMK